MPRREQANTSSSRGSIVISASADAGAAVAVAVAAVVAAVGEEGKLWLLQLLLLLQLSFWLPKYSRNC